VYNKKQPETIQAMFGSIAKTYDRTNAALSFFLHRYWNKRLVREVMKGGSTPPDTLLDLCSGTGDITFSFLQQASKNTNVYLLDFCEEMLECAKQKALKSQWKHAPNLTFIQADAQKIPLADSSIDSVTIAYGIRNVNDPEKCVKDVLRVLRPGGTFGILELTQPTQPVLRFGHKMYLQNVMPVLGWCFTANQQAYEYLCNSIKTFVLPADLEHMLIRTGFQQTNRIPLSGGIATILTGKKPYPL
jgi:demethylmenaquinone methyltransferase/2-methoxy-6-polyprenyl-1,4-benzoquinol methylase